MNKKNKLTLKRIGSVASDAFWRLIERAERDEPNQSEFTNPVYQRPTLGRHIRGLIVSTEQNRSWASALKRLIPAEMRDIFLNTYVELDTLRLPGDESEMFSALLTHPAFQGMQKGRYSFIITLGHTETRMVREARQMFNLKIHQLYATEGVFYQAPMQTSPGFAGVYNTPMQGSEYADALKGLISDVKKACLVFTPHRGLEYGRAVQETLDGHRIAICAALQAGGIEVTTHMWDFGSLYEHELSRKIKEVDVVITLDEPAAYKHCTKLATMCDTKKKVLCASEIDSLYQGAALGSGVLRESYARPMVRVLHDLLVNEGQATSFQIPMQSGLRCNERAMGRQGMHLTREVAAVLRLRSIFEGELISMMEAGR